MRSLTLNRVAGLVLGVAGVCVVALPPAAFAGQEIGRAHV